MGGGASGIAVASLKRTMSCFPFLMQYQDIRSCFSDSLINSQPTRPLAMESSMFLRDCGPLPSDLLLAFCFCTSSAFPTLSSPTGHHTASMHSLVSFVVHPILHPLFQSEVCFSEATHSVLALDLCSN